MGMIKNSLFRRKDGKDNRDAVENANIGEEMYDNAGDMFSQYQNAGPAPGYKAPTVSDEAPAADEAAASDKTQVSHEAPEDMYTQDQLNMSYSSDNSGTMYVPPLQETPQEDVSTQTNMTPDYAAGPGTAPAMGEAAAQESMRTMNIPFDLIDENPINDKIFNMKGIESLMKGIEKDGYLQAIGVFMKEDGRYEIFTGHRRFRAMKNLFEEGKIKDPTIPGVVFPMPQNEDEKTEKLISSNIRNRPSEPMDMARAIYEYESIRTKNKDYKGKLRDAVADYFGISPTKVYRFECLMRLIPELQELANTEGINYNVLSRASMLSEADQHELYDTLIKYAREEITKVKLEIQKQGHKEEGVNDINFEEITARVLSGKKINEEINNFLNDNGSISSDTEDAGDNTINDRDEAEEREADVSDDNYSGIVISGDDEEDEDEDDEYEEDEYEDEEEDEEEIEETVVKTTSITSKRKKINTYMTELEKMVESNDEVLQDKEELRSYLNRLKKLIAVLEQML